MMTENQGTGEMGARPLLNEPQLRHFEVFLSMLETALHEIEGLTARTPEGTQEGLIIYDPDLPPDFMKTMDPSIAAIRTEVSSLARTLKIEPRHRSSLRTVKAILTSELVRLDDSYARKLRGYGRVDPHIQVELDPILDRIRRDLVELLRACDHDSQRSHPIARP